MVLPKKLTLDDLRSGMQVFLNFPAVEKEIDKMINDDVQSILDIVPSDYEGDDTAMIMEILGGQETNITVKDMEYRIKIIVGTSHGSVEKIKRIFGAIFPDYKWSEIKNPIVREQLARFLSTQESDEFIPQFIKKSFALPDNWLSLLRNEDYLQRIVREMYKSKYAVRTGLAMEREICRIVEDIGYEAVKAKVDFVDSKEIDIVIPNIKDPQILIMSSYNLTTSSAQTGRANEQKQMYSLIQRHNGRRGRPTKNVLFINIIDGGGWLSRPGDLNEMHYHCHYCFSFSDLKDGFLDVLTEHLEI